MDDAPPCTVHDASFASPKRVIAFRFAFGACRVWCSNEIFSEHDVRVYFRPTARPRCAQVPETMGSAPYHSVGSHKNLTKKLEHTVDEMNTSIGMFGVE